MNTELKPCLWLLSSRTGWSVIRVIGKCPLVDNLVVAFVIGDETHVVVVPYFIHFRLGSHRVLSSSDQG
jgi:hypothetical protein